MSLRPEGLEVFVVVVGIVSVDGYYKVYCSERSLSKEGGWYER